MLKFAVTFDAPIALRYPRGEAYDGLAQFRAPIVLGKAEMIYEEQEIALVAVGSMVKTAEEVRERLKREGYRVSLINARFVKPIDEEMLLQIAKTHPYIVTMEENVASGGFGERVREFLSGCAHVQVQVLSFAIPDAYVEHGNVEVLKKEIGLDAEEIAEQIRKRALF